jgi:hypothetical protein
VEEALHAGHHRGILRSPVDPGSQEAAQEGVVQRFGQNGSCTGDGRDDDGIVQLAIEEQHRLVGHQADEELRRERVEEEDGEAAAGAQGRQREPGREQRQDEDGFGADNDDAPEACRREAGIRPRGGDQARALRRPTRSRLLNGCSVVARMDVLHAVHWLFVQNPSTSSSCVA